MENASKVETYQRQKNSLLFYFLYLEKIIFYSKTQFGLVTFFGDAGYLKRSNEILTSIQICLSLVDAVLCLTQNTWQQTKVFYCVGFDSDGLFFQMSEKYFQFREDQMNMSRNFFCIPRNWIYLLQNCFSSYEYFKDI